MKSAHDELEGMRWIVANLAVLLAASTVQAHSEPAGAEYEQAVWKDGTFDQTYYQDGYDLHDLWMWEAHDPMLGDGMMLRFHVYGGHTTGMYDTFRLNASFEVDNETHSFSWWTHDDEQWEGDLPLTIIASNRSAGAGGVVGGISGELPGDPLAGAPVPDVGGGWVHEMEVFVPLSKINATVGDTVSGWIWRSSAERDTLGGGRTEAPVDVAPGGFYITGFPAELREEAPAMPEADPEAMPEPDPDSLAGMLLAEAPPLSFFLQGPGRHLEASGEWADGKVVLRVANPYNATSQLATVSAPAGAVASNGSAAQIPAGKEVTFLYDVPLAASPQDLVWDVMTDIGGHARLEVSLPAAPAEEPSASPAPVSSKPLERTDPTASPPVPSKPAAPSADQPPIHEEDTPLALWVTMAALVALVIRRR